MPQEKRATPEKPFELRKGLNSLSCFAGESVPRWVIDASREYVYIRKVPVKKVQVGQVWKQDGTGDSFLVTKIYNEALTSFAVLRKTGSESEPPMRVRVAHSGGTADLPGFSYTQQADDF
ncbi:MAG TPA: hypothetical protein VNV41_02565 [Candidatus Acidoferrales bacterium]|jgi:hypothetical protein|nr:hypothetical protein [Candidatus Acidoferrales bacterium]